MALELTVNNMEEFQDIVDSKDFWMKMFSETDFASYIEKTYKIAHGAIMGDDADDEASE